MSQYSIKKHHYGPRFWHVWIALGLGWSVAQLPFSWQMALGKGIGKLVQWLSASRRRITRRNIELCFPELDTEQRRTLINRSFESLGIGFVEIAMAYWGRASKLAPLFHLSGLEHLEKVQSEGRGALLMTPHMTSLELCLRLFSERHPCAAMYKPAHNDLFENYSHLKRARFCLPVPNKKLRPFLQYIRKGGPAFYLPDQHYGIRSSVFAPFFGVQTATVNKTADFLKLTHAAVIPVMFGRKADGYHIDIHPPIEFPMDDDAAGATLLNQWMEKNIRLYPDQYLWQHRRFKCRPPGEPSVYQ